MSVLFFGEGKSEEADGLRSRISKTINYFSVFLPSRNRFYPGRQRFTLHSQVSPRSHCANCMNKQNAWAGSHVSLQCQKHQCDLVLLFCSFDVCLVSMEKKTAALSTHSWNGFSLLPPRMLLDTSKSNAWDDGIESIWARLQNAAGKTHGGGGG